MNRTGWAAAVGSLYKTRAGHTVTLVEYRVSVERGSVKERITADLGDGNGSIFCGASGSCEATATPSKGFEPGPLADFDLISAVQPAQVTKRVECKERT